MDVGSYNTDPVDYPDYAEAVGLAILEGRARGRGLKTMGTGAKLGTSRGRASRETKESKMAKQNEAPEVGVQDLDIHLVVSVTMRGGLAVTAQLEAGGGP